MTDQVQRIRELQAKAPDNCPFCGAPCSAPKSECLMWSCGTDFELTHNSRECMERELQILRKKVGKDVPVVEGSGS